MTAKILHEGLRINSTRVNSNLYGINMMAYHVSTEFRHLKLTHVFIKKKSVDGFNPLTVSQDFSWIYAESIILELSFAH